MGTVAGLHIGSALVGILLFWLLSKFMAGKKAPGFGG